MGQPQHKEHTFEMFELTDLRDKSRYASGDPPISTPITASHTSSSTTVPTSAVTSDSPTFISTSPPDTENYVDEECESTHIDLISVSGTDSDSDEDDLGLDRDLDRDLDINLEKYQWTNTGISTFRDISNLYRHHEIFLDLLNNNVTREQYLKFQQLVNEEMGNIPLNTPFERMFSVYCHISHDFIFSRLIYNPNNSVSDKFVILYANKLLDSVINLIIKDIPATCYLMDSYPLLVFSELCNSTVADVHIIGSYMRYFLSMQDSQQHKNRFYIPDKIRILGEDNFTADIGAYDLYALKNMLARYLDSNKQIYYRIFLNAVILFTKEKNLLKSQRYDFNDIKYLVDRPWFQLFLSTI